MNYVIIQRRRFYILSLTLIKNKNKKTQTTTKSVTLITAIIAGCKLWFNKYDILMMRLVDTKNLEFNFISFFLINVCYDNLGFLISSSQYGRLPVYFH